MSANRCTCPAAVDITFIGHLPDCPENDPDVLTLLHSLRSFAHKVKQQSDAQGYWSIAARCAAISEEATAAIESYESKPPAIHRN